MFSGHIEGAGPFRLARLYLADVTLPQGAPLAGHTCPIYGYLIVHPDGPVLFDTGVAEHAAIDRLYRPERRPVAEVLADSGVRPADVVAVVNSHLHFDHCGGNALFPGVPLLVQRTEYEASREPLYAVPGLADFPGVELSLLDGEADVLPGLHVIPTPGHTAGHQSLVIEAREGAVVIAGQAAYTASEYADPEPGHVRGRRAAWDPDQYLASLRRLQALAPRLVCFAHDVAVWERPECS